MCSSPKLMLHLDYSAHEQFHVYWDATPTQWAVSYANQMLHTANPHLPVMPTRSDIQSEYQITTYPLDLRA